MRTRILPVAAGLMLLLATTAESGPIRLAFRNMTVVGGTTFVVPVYVDSSLTGLNVISYQLDISFNSTYLTFDSVFSSGSMTSSWTFLEANVPSAGRLLIASSGSTALTDTGRLVFIRFKAKILPSNVGAGLSFTSASTLLNEGNIALSLVGATITIQVPPFITVSPNTALLTRGETQQFSVSGGTGPYSWATTNPSIATISASGLLSAVSPGMVKVIATDSLGVIDTSDNVEIRGMKLSVRDTSRFQGQSLDLPIYTTDLTGLNITSGQLTVTYNQALWTATDVVQAGTILASGSAPQFSVASGKISISFAGTSALSGAGILLYIRMQATNSTYGSSSVGFQGVLFNQDLLANTVSGSVSVTQLPVLSISPGGSQNLVKGEQLQFTASGGTAPYTWSVSDSSRASISSLGVLQVLRGGTVTVNAKDILGSKGTSGTINLYDFRLSVANTGVLMAIPHDTTVEVPLTVSTNDTGFSSFQFRLAYSTNYYLKLDSVVTAGTFSSSWNVVPAMSANSVQLAAAGSSRVFSAGSIVRMRFAIPDSTPRPSSTTITVTNVLFNEGAPIPFVENGSITVRGTNSKPTFSSRSPSTLTSVGVGIVTAFSVSASDPDGDALSYTWKVNGITEKVSTSSAFTKAFLGPSVGTTVTAVFTDPFGLSDSTTWTFNVVTSVERIGETLPREFQLEQNYPNPFNPRTTIEYRIPQRSHVILDVYNINGQRVEVLVDEELDAGSYKMQWTPSLTSGVYFYRLRAGNLNETRKLLLMK